MNYSPNHANSLHYKWLCDKENEYMSRKLNNMKPLVNFSCPHSFSVSKMKPKMNMINKTKEHELTKQNEYLCNKLLKIYLSPSKTFKAFPNMQTVNCDQLNNFHNRSSSMKRHGGQDPCKTNHANQFKWDIFRMTQENQFLYKRILDCKSSYLGKNKQYLKSARNSQVDRERDRSKLVNEKNRTFYMKSSSKHSEDPLLCESSKEDNHCTINVKPPRRFFETFQKRSNETLSDLLFHEGSANEQLESSRVLLSRKGYMNILGLVNIKMIYEKNRLKIIIEPYTVFSSNIFIIIFEGQKNLSNLCHGYSSYEDILKDLSFNGQNIILSAPESDLTYITKVLIKPSSSNE